MAQFKVRRLNEWANRKLSYSVLVDGAKQFELANGQEQDLTLNHAATLQVTMRWCGWPKLKIENTQHIREIIIKANRFTSFYIPIIAMMLLIGSSLQPFF